MPLYKIINHDSQTQILIWKITETFEELLEQIVLKEQSLIRLKSMKSEAHKCGFLSVRLLLNLAGYSDFDLHYDEFGKPFLNDEKKISITHSHHFSAIIISNQKVGIDIEMQRDKIIKIANKFVNPNEFNWIQNSNLIHDLTIIWGIKESVFKIRNEKGISFKNHIVVNPFEIVDNKLKATLNFENKKQEFNINFEEFEGFTLVYAFENLIHL